MTQMSRNSPSGLTFPPGTRHIHSDAPCAALWRKQCYMEGLESREISWGLKVLGFSDAHKTRQVTCTEIIIAGKNASENQVIASFPHETYYGLRFCCDTECNFSIYVDGTTPDKHQGTWRHSGNDIWTDTIMRSTKCDKGFVLLDASSDEAKTAGIEDNSTCGVLYVKIEPIVHNEREKMHNDPRKELYDGMAKCRRRSRGTRSIAAAGTAYGDATGQRFGRADNKSVVENDHLVGNILLACSKKEPSKYTSAYKPPLFTRETAGF